MLGHLVTRNILINWHQHPIVAILCKFPRDILSLVLLLHHFLTNDSEAHRGIFIFSDCIIVFYPNTYRQYYSYLHNYSMREFKHFIFHFTNEETEILQLFYSVQITKLESSRAGI